MRFDRNSAQNPLPPIFMAEIGALFNQDLALAEHIIHAIAAAGAGPGKLPLVLKTEILHDPEICLDDDTQQTFLSKDGRRRVERYRDLIERKVLPLSAYERLLGLARKLELPFCVSVYDRIGVDFAVTQGAVALKTSSSNITHIPLIRYASSKNRPVIIDTGRANLAEVDRAVRTARNSGAPQIVVQHSQDGHPAPAENGNLRTIHTYRKAFGLPVGLSDHYATSQMLHVAIGLGIDLLERNIAADPNALEQDHAFSSGIDELSDLLNSLHQSWVALGKPFRDPANRSGLVSTSGRMGLIAKRMLYEGEILSDENISFALPIAGIPVECFDEIVGCRLRNAIGAGKPIRWIDVERN